MTSATERSAELELSQLREQIDALDHELVALLAKRFRVTEAVSVLKAIHRLSAVDPKRESQQEVRLQKLAVENSVDPDVVKTIFRTIVSQVVVNHQSVAKPLSTRQQSP